MLTDISYITSYYDQSYINSGYYLVAGIECTIMKLNVRYTAPRAQLPSESTASITDYKQHMNILLINAYLV